MKNGRVSLHRMGRIRSDAAGRESPHLPVRRSWDMRRSAGLFLTRTNPYGSVAGAFSAGIEGTRALCRRIFLREASQYITPCSPLQKTVDSLCRAAPVPLRRPCAPMAARSFPAPVRSPRGRRHILRETGKESALQYQ